MKFMKLFEGEDNAALEAEVNDWLENICKCFYTVTSTSICVSNGIKTIMIFYTM